MVTTLFRNFDLVATMDEERREIPGGSVLVDGNVISGVYDDHNEPHADRVIDGTGKILLPGFVNTHHHLYQTLFRSVPGAHNSKLFDWLVFLYRRWQNLDPEAVRISAAIGCAELLLSGATTTSDHFYLFPQAYPNIFSAEIEGAMTTGIRFHPCRGSMSLSKKDGGLPPDSVVQSEDEILRDCQLAIERYHNPDPLSMIRIALAPCSPFSVTAQLMRQSTKLADEYGVLLHTHLAETLDEEEFCLKRFGARPVDYMEQLGWLRRDVWFAHLVHVNEADITKLSAAQCGLAHCPSSNMTLGSGIAPVVEMAATDMAVGIGVDGSASNDSSSMVREVRQAMLLQRVRYGAESFTARDALYLATMGGAKVLHRHEEIGSIEVGKAADLITFDMRAIEYAGAQSDPLAAIVHCAAEGVDTSMVNGEMRVLEGRLVDESLYRLVPRHNEISLRLINQ
jgi:8-oxoguanine deaminase